MNENDPQISQDITNLITVGNAFSEHAKMSMRNVNVFYADKQAIHDVSLDIGKNEVVAMIGPSGCGKSTFFTMHESYE